MRRPKLQNGWWKFLRCLDQSGTRNEYRIVWNQDYLLCDGIHEALVSVQDWEDAQVRLRSQGERYKRYERHDNEHAYLLTGLR